jgi:hypothetical protein
MTPVPLGTTAGALPPAANRILLLRTAQLSEVQWARAELTRRYPSAEVAVLGTRLHALGAFDGCRLFEVPDGWLTPRSVHPLEGGLKQFAPDLIVMCLNNEWRSGYERVSRIVRRLPARHKVVAGYNRQWSRWRHADYIDGHPILRWLVEASLIVLYPLTAIYLLAKPSSPLYANTPGGAPR